MAKLILSVDGGVLSRAKLYAKQRGVSISEMVEAYLAAVAETSSPGAADTPILRAVRGTLKSANRDTYRKHLIARYHP